MLHEISLQQANESQIHEIASLSKNFIEHDLQWTYTPARIRKILRDPTKNIIVALRQNTLLGFAIMSYDNFQANLDLIAVKPDYRREGIGDYLVEWLEAAAVAAGITFVYVQVRQSNKIAVGFYKQRGYQIIEHIVGYYQGKETAVILCKTLRSLFVS